MVSTQNDQLILLSVLTLLFRSILHDPKSFDDPMEFRPERYLKDGKLISDDMDTNSVVFGFGRRLVYRKYSTTHLIDYPP